MADRLEDIWRIQIDQQALWHDWSALSETDREALTKELLLGLTKTIADLQRLLDVNKFHILRSREERAANVTTAERGVDVFKFLVAVMALHGVTAQEFWDEFIRKTRVVASKWEWEKADLSGQEIMASDIDGCLADWYHGFIEWASRQKGTHGLAQLTPDTIGLPEWEILKDEFAATGGFLRLQPLTGSVAVLNRWRVAKQDRKLVLVTARPYRRHPRVYADTEMWCKQVGLDFDHILFERDKAEAIRKLAPAKPIAFIEDRAKHSLEVASTGVRVIKLPDNNGRNQEIEHPLIRQVQNWRQIDEIINRI